MASVRSTTLRSMTALATRLMYFTRFSFSTGSPEVSTSPPKDSQLISAANLGLVNQAQQQSIAPGQVEHILDVPQFQAFGFRRQLTDLGVRHIRQVGVRLAQGFEPGQMRDPAVFDPKWLLSSSQAKGLVVKGLFGRIDKVLSPMRPVRAKP